MPLYPLLPLVAVAAQNATAALNSRAWEGLKASSSCRIAWKASEPPGAIKEPWGREAAPRLADGDRRDERAVDRRVLRHEMLQRLGHLMNLVRGRQRQCLCKLLVGGQKPPPGDLLQVLPKP